MVKTSFHAMGIPQMCYLFCGALEREVLVARPCMNRTSFVHGRALQPNFPIKQIDRELCCFYGIRCAVINFFQYGLYYLEPFHCYQTTGVSKATPDFT